MKMVMAVLLVASLAPPIAAQSVLPPVLQKLVPQQFLPQQFLPRNFLPPAVANRLTAGPLAGAPRVPQLPAAVQRFIPPRFQPRNLLPALSTAKPLAGLPAVKPLAGLPQRLAPRNLVNAARQLRARRRGQ